MSTFKTALIEDARIAMITDEEVYGVQSSASQSTYQQFNAISIANSSVVFNVQIPSENILIDRHVLLQSKVAITVAAGSATDAAYQVPIGANVDFIYGLNSAFQAFPLNSLMTTTQLTLNNVSTSTNTADVLAPLLKMNDSRMLSRWNSLTPSMVDAAYGVYEDGILTNNNSLASFNNNSYDNDVMPRGAFPCDIVVQHFIGGVYADDSLVSTAVTDTWIFTLGAIFTEPFVALSPFINTDPENQAGLVGINNLSLVLNIDSTCHRLFSSACPYITGISLGNGVAVGNILPSSTGLSATKLLFNFLSLQPEQYAKISTKNVVPYMDYPRYLTSQANSQAIPPLSSSGTISSMSIQLNQVPDMILIVAREPLGNQDWSNSASFLAIQNISVNFNNSSGLLATATQQDLYNLSVRNGSAQSFYEFAGQASVNNNGAAAAGGVLTKLVPTVGSVLVLNPCYDFSLPSYLSASSLGQYQFQFNLKVFNQFDYAITPEILIICVNSGLLSTQQGTSQIFTGILTKEQVLKTKEQNPVPHLDSAEYSRLVGGKQSNRGMANILGLLRHHGHRKHMPDMSSSGGATSGGATSGGATSAGSRARKHY